MRMSPEARAERKAAQLARVAARGDDDYPELYAKQPREVRVAAEQGAERKAIRDAKVAINNAMGADARGAVEVFTGAPAGEIATLSGNDAPDDEAGSIGT